MVSISDTDRAFNSRPSYFIDPNGMATVTYTSTEGIEKFDRLPYKKGFFGKKIPKCGWEDVVKLNVLKLNHQYESSHVIFQALDNARVVCEGHNRIGYDKRLGLHFIYCTGCMRVCRYLDDKTENEKD